MYNITTAELIDFASKTCKGLSGRLDLLPTMDVSRVDPTRISEDLKKTATILQDPANKIDAEVANPTTTKVPEKKVTSPDGNWNRSSASEFHTDLAEGLKKAHGIK